MTEKKEEYFYFVDILRIIALLGSFLHHSQVIYFLYGHSFFFFLSGFLLTVRFKIEIENTQQFSFFKFLLRRFMKILPLYYLIVFAVYFILPHISNLTFTTIPIWWYLTFTANFSETPHIFILMLLWSVAVQEQFYIFISICFKFFYKYLVFIAVGMILVSLGFKIFSYLNDSPTYAHTLNHFSTYACGILYAIYYKQIHKLISYQTSMFLFILSIISLYTFSFYLDNHLIWKIFDNLFVGVFFIFIFNFLLESKSKIVKNKFVNSFGNLYYGLYCYQGIVITFSTAFLFSYFKNQSYLLIIINYFLIVILAYLSNRFFEQPILNLKKYFKP
jgi:peptidoglycan/LPS O-acetylase OafA/YrhL